MGPWRRRRWRRGWLLVEAVCDEATVAARLASRSAAGSLPISRDPVLTVLHHAGVVLPGVRTGRMAQCSRSAAGLI